MRFYSVLLVVIMGLFLSSCGKESSLEKIEDYIEKHNLDAESTAEGLYYVIEKPGNSEMPVFNSIVTVHYHGTLTNGEVFDSTMGKEEPSNFSLDKVIKGWQIGIPLIGKGGKIKLIVPPSLGYGSSKVGSIPSNSVLIFDVDLIDFE